MNTEELALQLQKTEDRSLRNEGRIKKLEEESRVLHKLATSVAVMAEQLRTLNGTVGTLTGELEALKDRPARRWEGLVNNLIWAVAAAALTALLPRLGL